MPAGVDGTSSTTPTEAAQNPKHTSDLLRRFKEMGLSMRHEYREPAELDQIETDLRVSCKTRGVAWKLANLTTLIETGS